MRDLWNSFLRFFSSLQLTVVLLALSIVLVFVATIDQVNLGVWAVQEKYFRSFFVMWIIPGTRITFPVFPGGYLVGGMLLLNLLFTHNSRGCFTWKKAGLIIAHAGLILLLVGELITGLMQQDFSMQLAKGETKNYSDSQRLNELVVTDTTNRDYDEVVAIPESRLSSGKSIQHPKLPFRLLIKEIHPNALLSMRKEGPNSPPAMASAGLGAQVEMTPQPITYKTDERNLPAALVEVSGPDATVGTFIVSPQIQVPQPFTYSGHNYTITMRPTRQYTPFSLTLEELRHDVYAGSDIPRNFSSLVKLRSQDGKDDREVKIYMNNPLRYGGLTFYQYQMNEANGYSVLQVVRNPGWLIPYISCLMMGIGLAIHFAITLSQFIGQRTERMTART